jgi:DNA-binding transcriptional MerR regulator
MPPAEKAAGALRTIGELAQEIGRPQHILRYWETRFPQLRPLTRAGNRRYYRPDDVALVRRIHHLLTDEGYTIRGVQKVLRARGGGEEDFAPELAEAPPAAEPVPPSVPAGVGVERLIAIRDGLASALYD